MSGKVRGTFGHGIRPELRASVRVRFVGLPQPVARPWLAALWAWILGAPEPSCRKRRPSGHPRGPCPASSATASGGERDRLVAPTTPSGVLASLHDGPNRQSRFIIDLTSVDDPTTEERLAWPKAFASKAHASQLRRRSSFRRRGQPLGLGRPFRHFGGRSVRIPLTSWREEKYGTRASEKTRQLDKYEPYSTEG